jgi:hypothetical protein
VWPVSFHFCTCCILISVYLCFVVKINLRWTLRFRCTFYFDIYWYIFEVDNFDRSTNNI